ncbi:glycosyltransferase family 4 protein [Anianabacter salinae]|uniref:glycosyltransferase family 4 protein n=1 Tax=Anianabacter salinae TaxID=2851023 RepID=UPI00225E296B|nr:glycosyltransferase family 4 protein [Anianabacter salinae]MBV0913472.1 glycosyltransferase family 4 protein [Anianabacter salinae]
MTARRRMLVLCPFPQGVAAGQRLKYEQYFDDWRAAGWDIDVSSFMDPAMWKITYKPGHLAAKVAGTLRGYARRARDLLRIPRYDLVYVFMWVTPFGVSLEERLVRRLARRVIYDVEDNILVEQSLPKEMNPNPIARLIKGPGKARFLIRTADHVITSSPFLNDFCLGLNKRRACTYVTSSVDTDVFRPGPPRAEGSVVIGWTGTYSSRIYLDLLRGVFQTLAHRVTFRLRVIGNFDYDLPGVDLEVVRWSKDREAVDMQAIDIGVYPLPMDDWVLGKSGLKAIQYMAFGAACVATDVGTTPMLIRHGENGLLVRSETDWLEALERLVKDAELRRRLGQAARKDAVEKYSTQAIAADYRAVLQDVMGQGK